MRNEERPDGSVDPGGSVDGEIGDPPAADGERLSLRGITKSFHGVTVLDDVSFDVGGGEIVSVVGENGAGKSTLMKIIAGVYHLDSGSIRLDGRDVAFKTRAESQDAGVRIVFQEFNLLPDRTVADNLFCGSEPTRFGVLDQHKMRDRTRDALALVGASGVSPTTYVRDLPVADQQLVEIAKALMGDARLLIMDEPTASLSEVEAQKLFERLERLRNDGLSVLYISHRIPEVFRLSDRIVVLKDGALVKVFDKEATTPTEVVESMVGRPLSSFYPPPAEGHVVGDVVVSVRGGASRRVHDIDIDLRRGEILGIGGLAGSGRTELAQALFGVDPFTRGEMRIGDRDGRPKSPREAIAAGMSMIPEDRKGEGLILGQPAVPNGALALWALARRGREQRTHDRRVRDIVEELLKTLELRAAGEGQPVRFLSGGNQQKVVLAKWLAMRPEVLLVDEPTRGIDVGAKSSIFELLRRLSNEGVAILMISSELPELIGLSDRIVVMADQTNVAELSGEATESDIMHAATGQSPDKEAA